MLISKLRLLTGQSFKAVWNRKYRDISCSHQEGKEILVIYQMGKVGSSTIKKSLNAINLDMNMYHVHALSHKRIKALKKVYKMSSRVSGKAVVHDHLIESAFLRNRLDEGRGEHWKLISLIRDPVARNISSFFQSFDQFHPAIALELKENRKFKESSIDELIEVFFRKFDHDMPLRWFDSYLNPVFEVDIFEAEFPVEKGYKIYHGEKADLLLLKLEDISKNVSNAFHEFMGIEDFSLLNANKMEDKINYQAYMDFKKKIKFPESYLDKMYSSRLVRHFYTSYEIDSFKKKWGV